MKVFSCNFFTNKFRSKFFSCGILVLKDKIFYYMMGDGDGGFDLKKFRGQLTE